MKLGDPVMLFDWLCKPEDILQIGIILELTEDECPDGAIDNMAFVWWAEDWQEWHMLRNLVEAK